ncbi:MAG: hypothetical protein ABEJ34_01205 [Haloferacaceae archaeon]
MGIIPESITDRLSDRPLAAALVVYAAVCVPAYLFLVSSSFLGIDHSIAGKMDPSVAIGGLLMGSLMFVPALTIQFKQQYGGGQAERLGFVGGGGE